jgi:N-acetyl sugar amidotransferase
VRYCSQCILPDTRPHLEIGSDGVCAPCRLHGEKDPQGDRVAREGAFEELVAEVRSLGRPYDCVIPVSGGKDSTWQTLTCLEHGLRPLAVTWRAPGRTALGERNLRNLVELGTDHIDFSIDPKVERRFLLASLERYGTTAIPMHLAIFNVPATVAARYDVPLIVWGENSALEYFGDEEDAKSFVLTGGWIRKYGAVHGTTAADWVGDGLSARDLTPYWGPTDEELAAKGVRAVFLGMYFPWDPVQTFDVARRHGFEPAPAPLTGAYTFADVDDRFISIHHWLKWFKFGFTRVWDNLSLEIRNGRLTREQAIDEVRRLGDQTPTSDIEAFCDYVGISSERFFAIAETFRDRAIWERDGDGVWKIPGFLIEEWEWT